MKLEINLADQAEVAAAVPLLQLLLSGASPAPAKPLYEEFKEAQAADNRVPLTAVESNDAAAVFGSAPAVPLAPSILPDATVSTAAPPPPVATAPTTTTPGPVSSGAGAGSVELDSRGLPWDGRIHSSTKSKLANGQWKNARGKSPEQIARVEDELRTATSAPPLAPVPAAPPVVPTVPTPPPAVGVGASSQITSASQPVAPVADPVDFVQLMPRISAAVASGVLPPSALNDACVANGLPSIVGLQQNVAYVPLVWASLKQTYPALA
jgi:hypothetical protein